MHNFIKTIHNQTLLHTAKAALPPNVQFWREACQVRHKEYLQRPQYLSVRATETNPIGKFPLSSVYFDTILAVQGIEGPEEIACEVRLQGRIEPITIGDTLDLLGVYDPRTRGFSFPRAVVSRKAQHWWAAAEVIRADNPRFEVCMVDRSKYGDNSYEIEGKEWLRLSVPLPLYELEEQEARRRARSRAEEELINRLFRIGQENVDFDAIFDRFLREERGRLNKVAWLDEKTVRAAYIIMAVTICRDTPPKPAKRTAVPEYDDLNLPPE